MPKHSKTTSKMMSWRRNKKRHNNDRSLVSLRYSYRISEIAPLLSNVKLLPVRWKCTIVKMSKYKLKKTRRWQPCKSICPPIFTLISTMPFPGNMCPEPNTHCIGEKTKMIGYSMRVFPICRYVSIVMDLSIPKSLPIMSRMGPNRLVIRHRKNTNLSPVASIVIRIRLDGN